MTRNHASIADNVKQRATAQRAFDSVARGLLERSSFIAQQLLPELQWLAKKLSPQDKRHDILRQIEQHAKGETAR